MNIYDTVIKGTHANSYLAKGSFILKSIAENRNNHEVHLLCYEKLVSEYEISFSPTLNINFHDCMKTFKNKKHSIREIADRILKNAKKKVILIIDSLSICLLHTKLCIVYKELLDLISLETVPNFAQIISIVHEDITEEVEVEHIKKLCNTYIHVQYLGDTTMLQLNLEHKRSNGKCASQNLNGKLKSDGNFKLIVNSPQNIEEISNEKSLPVNLASFKLVLEESEREAKDKLILPYTQVQNTNCGGIIHYIPDEADDWDEEDPDDDLEI
ncbi:elongator complex protein 5 isoform X2 [Daktulosphaira vitifoliae]|uniref:elongator complex protein 5 isoform X2 n=1 Tax=Daktulosphaira vitifoliae TaxID=58002 RepID=UPI0021A9AD8E|nr:elongator complex protein 5 isoform X2 [Daktulosphaira vitifoliae]